MKSSDALGALRERQYGSTVLGGPGAAGIAACRGLVEDSSSPGVPGAVESLVPLQLCRPIHGPAKCLIETMRASRIRPGPRCRLPASPPRRGRRSTRTGARSVR